MRNKNALRDAITSTPKKKKVYDRNWIHINGFSINRTNMDPVDYSGPRLKDVTYLHPTNQKPKKQYIGKDVRIFL
jgi:hypothetical protein